MASVRESRTRASRFRRQLLRPFRAIKKRVSRLLPSRNPLGRTDINNNNDEIRIEHISQVTSALIQCGAQGELYLRCNSQDNRLSLAQLQKDDPSFEFTWQRLCCQRDKGAGQPLSLWDFRCKGNPRKALIGDDDATGDDVGVQDLSPLPDSASSLRATDPRFFIPHPRDKGKAFELESLKEPGFFIAVNAQEQKLELRRKTEECDDFRFVIKSLDPPESEP